MMRRSFNYLKKIWPRYVLMVFIILFTGVMISCGSNSETITWKLNSVDEIAGSPVEILGSPKVISSENGKAIEFNGKNDGLLLHSNPIAGWENFLIEVDIKPYPGFPENVEQRFLHIQDPANEDRRILIELRLNEDDQWYGDWFIKTENESLTLVDPTKIFPLNEWATISLLYENGEVKGAVNGEIQVTGNIKYLSSGEKANVSIGTRMDQRSWFKGAIKAVRFISLDK